MLVFIKAKCKVGLKLVRINILSSAEMKKKNHLESLLQFSAHEKKCTKGKGVYRRVFVKPETPADHAVVFKSSCRQTYLVSTSAHLEAEKPKEVLDHCLLGFLPY